MAAPRPTPGPRVHLDIDALHLHGYPEGARAPIMRALTQELERLIEERGIPGGSEGRLQLDRLRIDTAHRDHAAAGRDAARTLFGHLQLHAAGGLESKGGSTHE